MFGNNPKRAPVQGDGSSLDVVEIFATLQGEGPFAGWPAIFIRLGGCNLACRFCDTEFEVFQTLSCDSICEKLDKLTTHHKLVVITGGEPLRQPIAPLCEALLARGYQVQLETNGTLFRPLPEAVQLICSPKNEQGQGYAPVRPDLAARVLAYKFIVSASREGYQSVPEMAGNVPVYVQPMDEQDAHKNAANLAYATDLALRYGYRLSIQLHKLAEIR